MWKVTGAGGPAPRQQKDPQQLGLPAVQEPGHYLIDDGGNRREDEELDQTLRTAVVLTGKYARGPSLDPFDPSPEQRRETAPAVTAHVVFLHAASLHRPHT